MHTVKSLVEIKQDSQELFPAFKTMKPVESVEAGAVPVDFPGRKPHIWRTGLIYGIGLLYG